MTFDTDSEKRYSRQIKLEEIGAEGQKKLADSDVLIIGAGGLGSPAALYLAAAGVGHIGIADPDCVELSNLQRQIIHRECDISAPKVLSAERAVKEINSGISVKTHKIRVTEVNISELISGYDFILDCTDNFSSKLLISDACVKADKPFCYGGVHGFCGQLMTCVPHKSPCLRCLFGDDIAGENVPKEIMGAVCGVIGSMQACEAVKYITGAGTLLSGRLMTFDMLKGESRVINIPVNKNCIVCG